MNIVLSETLKNKRDGHREWKNSKQGASYRLLVSGLWRRKVSYVFTDVSEEHFQDSRLSYSADGGCMFLQNVDKYLPDYTTLHFIRQKSSQSSGLFRTTLRNKSSFHLAENLKWKICHNAFMYYEWSLLFDIGWQHREQDQMQRWNSVEVHGAPLRFWNLCGSKN